MANALFAPVTLLPAGLGVLALLLASSPRQGGPGGDLQFTVDSRLPTQPRLHAQNGQFLPPGQGLSENPA